MKLCRTTSFGLHVHSPHVNTTPLCRFAVQMSCSPDEASFETVLGMRQERALLDLIPVNSRSVYISAEWFCMSKWNSTEPHLITRWHTGCPSFVHANRTEGNDCITEFCSDRRLFLPNTCSCHKNRIASRNALFHFDSAEFRMTTLPAVTSGVDQLRIADLSSPHM